MNCSAISNAFNDYGCTLSALLKRPNVYILSNSEGFPQQVVDDIISKLGYCAIFSKRRINENLMFTFVPYIREAYFDQVQCERKEKGDEELWRLVESVRNLIASETPIYQGDMQRFANLAEARTEMVAGTLVQSSLVIEFANTAPAEGRVLDLGCGRGVNSMPLLLKGWDVTAIDVHPDALSFYHEEIDSSEIFQEIPEENLTLIQADITESDFKGMEPFNLVICMDVLSYIDSVKLRSLLSNIREALAPGGIFIGTLMFSKEGQNSDQMNFFKNLGIHIYPGADLIPEILEHSGFIVEKATLRYHSLEEEPQSVQFTARKEN